MSLRLTGFESIMIDRIITLDDRILELHSKDARSLSDQRKSSPATQLNTWAYVHNPIVKICLFQTDVCCMLQVCYFRKLLLWIVLAFEIMSTIHTIAATYDGFPD